MRELVNNRPTMSLTAQRKLGINKRRGGVNLRSAVQHRREQIRIGTLAKLASSTKCDANISTVDSLTIGDFREFWDRSND